MASTLKAVVGKLNDTMRTALEGAAGLCLARTHYDIEIEHFLTKLQDAGGTDFAGIVQHFGVDKARLAGELGRSLDALKTGNARTPAFSPSLLRMLREAWTIGSLEFGAGQVSSGAAILALVSDDELSRIGPRCQQGVPQDRARGAPQSDARHSGRFARVHRGTDRRPGFGCRCARRRQARRQDAEPRSIHGEPHRECQKAGKIDPVLGRDFEIRQMVDILTRRRQNNPILTGEAGVGKTAVVEGFRAAHRRRATCRPACATSPCARSIWRCCRPARASRASSKTASRA